MTIQGGIILTEKEQVLLEEKVEVKTFNIVTGNMLSISNKDNIGHGLLYLTNYRLLFLVHRHRYHQCLEKISVLCCIYHNY